MKAAKLKRIKDAKVSVPYVTYNKVEQNVRYKLFNNLIEINLKDIIDKILDDAGISGFDTKQVQMVIPYNIEDTVSGEVLSIIIDKKRFNLRLPEMEVVRNNQQKIDYDNTHPHRWSVAQWIKFFEKKYWDSYGFNSVELDLRGKEGAVRRGKAVSKIKKLISKIKAIDNVKLDERDVVQYINWVFTKKSQKISLTIPLITSDGIIQEWMVWRKNRKKKKVSKKAVSDKWRQK